MGLKVTGTRQLFTAPKGEKGDKGDDGRSVTLKGRIYAHSRNTDKCVGCELCYLYCPDGVISINDGKAAIDYDFCKGCGICAKICRIKAIEMEAERK